MKRLISILIIFFLIVSIAIFEEIYVNNFINNLSSNADIVSVCIKENENNLNIDKINNNFSHLKNFWSKSKKVLSYFINYEKIKTLDESFIKLDIAIKRNDFSLASENIALIKEYSQFFEFLMGFNLNNLF